MNTQPNNSVVSQELIAEVIAPMLTLALFHALVKGIGALRNKLKGDDHSPKLDAQIKKIEAQASKLQTINTKVSKRGLSDVRKVIVNNGFITGSDARAFIRNLDSNYGKFMRLYKAAEKPMTDLRALNDKPVQDSEQQMDDKYIEILKVVNSHWSEKERAEFKALAKSSVKNTITTADQTTMEALLKMISRLLQLKITYMNLPYSDRAKEASVWVWEAVDSINHNIDAALSYAELSIR